MCPSKPKPPRSLIEPPRSRSTADCEIIKLFERGIRQVDAKHAATHALVQYCCYGRLSCCQAFDRDSTAAVRVAVRQSSHQEVRESHNMVDIAVVCCATGSKTGLVVCHVSLTRLSKRALVAVGVSSGQGHGRGRHGMSCAKRSAKDVNSEADRQVRELHVD